MASWETPLLEMPSLLFEEGSNDRSERPRIMVNIISFSKKFKIIVSSLILH